MFNGNYIFVWAIRGSMSSTGMVLPLFIVIILLSCSGCTLPQSQTNQDYISDLGVSAMYPGRTHYVTDIEMQIPVAKVPDTIMVYSKQQLTKSEILQIASDLGISGEPIDESGWIFIREGPYAFSSQPGGRVITYDDQTPMPGFTPEYIDSHLPSDDEARKIADEFLTTHNIEPEGMKFIGTNHNVGYFSYKNEQIKAFESINVMYRHFINDHEIFNEKLGLEVTVNKTVKSMFWKWSRYQSYREYRIIHPEEAVDRLQNTGIIVFEEMQNPEKASVRNITLGYLGEIPSQDLDYLIPVYMIEGEVSGNRTTTDFFQYILAAPDIMIEKT